MSGELDFDWDEGSAEESEESPSTAGVMTLNVNGKVVATDPSAEEVRDALEGLPGGDQDSFAILGDGEQTYMQTAGCAADGFHVEYRDGSDERHFMIQGMASLDETVAAFESYLLGDGAYLSNHPWVPLAPIEDSVSESVAPGLFVMFLLMISFGCYIAINFLDALTPRYLPLSAFGVAGGAVAWTTMLLSPKRLATQVSYVIGAVFLCLLLAAQVLLGDRGVILILITCAIGLMASMLVSMAWSRARQAGEYDATGGPPS